MIINQTKSHSTLVVRLSVLMAVALIRAQEFSSLCIDDLMCNTDDYDSATNMAQDHIDRDLREMNIYNSIISGDLDFGKTHKMRWMFC